MQGLGWDQGLWIVSLARKFLKDLDIATYQAEVL